MRKRFCVYIMASKPWGTLYVGVRAISKHASISIAKGC